MSRTLTKVRYGTVLPNSEYYINPTEKYWYAHFLLCMTKQEDMTPAIQGTIDTYYNADYRKEHGIKLYER